jgi:hypothetical protein
MQRHAMLMYTSCGWFFDEISGIETVQVLQYAGRVIQLARQTGGEDLEPQFVETLARARSNIAEYGDGARIWEMFVKPAFVDLCKVGAHFAISAMFDGHHETPMFCYDTKPRDYRRLESGLARFGVGQARVTSKITREWRELTFAGIHMGDQVLHAGVRDSGSDEDYTTLAGDAMAAFSTGDFPEVLRVLDAYFGGMQYSLRSLFKDEQKRIIDIILQQTLQDAETSYHTIYQKHGPLLRFLKEMDQPVPEVLRFTAQFVLNSDLVRTFNSDPVDSVRVSMLLELVKREGVQIEEAGVGYAASNALTRLMKSLRESPQDFELLQRANLLVALLEMLPFKVSYWNAQNIYYALLQTEYPAMARQQDSASRQWAESFAALGEKLQVSVPPVSAKLELRMAS